MSIEQNRKTVFIATPYDKQISALNDRINETYIYYGKSGASKKEMQSRQDKNAESYGLSNKVNRAVSKSSQAYENSSWDLIDASRNDDKAIVNAKDEDLPKEMKGMSVEKRKEYVKQKAAERAEIQNEIQSLNRKRQEYITTNTPKEEQASMLDAAMIKAIKQQAASKNFSWK